MGQFGALVILYPLEGSLAKMLEAPCEHSLHVHVGA